MYKLRNWINKDKINLSYLSLNPYASDLLEKNKDKVDWFYISFIISIFDIDYDFLRNRLKNSFGEELMMNRFHPDNFEKWSGWGFDIF